VRNSFPPTDKYNLSYPGGLGPEGVHNLEIAWISELHIFPKVLMDRKLSKLARRTHSITYAKFLKQSSTDT